MEISRSRACSLIPPEVLSPVPCGPDHRGRKVSTSSQPPLIAEEISEPLIHANTKNLFAFATSNSLWKDSLFTNKYISSIPIA